MTNSAEIKVQYITLEGMRRTAHVHDVGDMAHDQMYKGTDAHTHVGLRLRVVGPVWREVLA